MMLKIMLLMLMLMLRMEMAIIARMMILRRV